MGLGNRCLSPVQLRLATLVQGLALQLLKASEYDRNEIVQLMRRVGRRHACGQIC